MDSTAHEKTGPVEDTITIQIDEKDLDKVLMIGSQLNLRLREGLSRFLLSKLDALAWSHSYMVGIDPKVMCHRLNIDSKHKGVRQKRIALVGATVGHVLLSFMEAYSYERDQEHTSYITDRGIYYYIGMSFGLINVGATYQMLANKMFKRRIWKIMEVYADDMLVKSKETEDHVVHLAEMFRVLRKYKMKLNPKKCVFGVESGKFVRFIINHRKIEANPAKMKALLNMKSLTSVKQVQSLMGRITALNRFVSKSSDICKEFIEDIKGMKKDFVWTLRCEEVYTDMEKLVYVFILTARKLKPYFQVYRIKVRTAYPPRHVFYNPELSRRMFKWPVEFGQFDLEDSPSPTINGHALVDFLLEFDSKVYEKAILLTELSSQGKTPEKVKEEFPHPWWIIHVDGAVNNNGAGVRIVLITS
ncbi:uncharacterized protein LOC141724929 [Apium graveolens]|uniref:uncharacterized protein LOC141724929 n=1 Tax=Apium graveolens TaxID=4045 RepID=UPI003D7C01E3